MSVRLEQKRDNGYSRTRPPTAPKPSRVPKPPEPAPQSSGAPSNTDMSSSTTQSSRAPAFPDLPPPLPSSSPPSRQSRRRHTVAETDSPKHKEGGGYLQPGLGPVAERSPGHSPPRMMKGDPVPLKTFMESRSRDLPLMIQTDVGLYGNTAHTTLLAADSMAAHFVMKTQVVRAALDHGGTYHIPCTSSNLFSLLFDPKNNIIEAMNGFYFESVSDMMLHTPLPPAIKAVRSFQGSTSEFSVQEGDVLLVSRRIKSRGVPKRKYISCYKASTGEKKRLYENCTAGFTTRPEDVQLSLSDLLNSRYSPLPLKAVMYYVGSSHDSPQVVTLLAKTDEESLVLSRSLCQDTDCNTARPLRKHVLRIRKDMDMSIYVVALDETERKQLSEDTYTFYQGFNSTCINEHLFPEDPVWPQFERIQSSLYRNVKSDIQPTSMELIKTESRQRKKRESESEALYQNTVIGTPKQQTKAQRSLATDYETLGVTRADEFAGNSMFWELGRPISPDGQEEEKKKEKEGISEDLLLELMMEVNTANRQMLIQVDQLKGEKEAMSTDIHRVKNRIGEMSRNISALNEMKTTIKTLQETVASLTEELDQLKQNREGYASLYQAMPSTIEAENQHVLRSLSVEQVLQILEKMKLTEYVETFEKECVNGEMLADCEEDMLKVELSISNRLHRRRLMLLINGNPQIWQQLERPLSAAEQP